jgi:hypothetical protein
MELEFRPFFGLDISEVYFEVVFFPFKRAAIIYNGDKRAED